MHRNRKNNAFICINDHVNVCTNCMLSAHRDQISFHKDLVRRKEDCAKLHKLRESTGGLVYEGPGTTKV